MKTKVQAVNFDMTEKLQEFVEKRVAKLERFYAEIIDAEIVLTLEKPEQANNKNCLLYTSPSPRDS